MPVSFVSSPLNEAIYVYINEHSLILEVQEIKDKILPFVQIE